ncbi:uncharacterized protein BXZ73DRAFT_88324 [Epithele typhae]|uniref:uncharacterized protein n=1 Tax=Epithele typhae TaxID=378194 RepID=UPI00200781D1|nr:uncharacterized protein BXZ73DRAFT_88324 [Epithele typhae]KAH9941141.1 hypothetical protein BXZ73DRAFT_88324 [Epithele typhae]
MSVSPPIRRLSTSSSSREDLIYQYEAEEERIINILSRKLEQLREEKIELENVLEAESESHVNRLSRELTALRLAQQQQQQLQQPQPQAGPSHVNGSGSVSPQDFRTTAQLAHLLSRSNGDPSPDMIIDALRRENEALRSRLVETEQDFVRISRLNEIYREELIQHRRRVSLALLSVLYHNRARCAARSTSASPTTSIHAPAHIPIPPSRPSAAAVPIPRPPSQIRRPRAQPESTSASASTTPLSHSPSSASTSPFPFSPAAQSPFPASSSFGSPAAPLAPSLPESVAHSPMGFRSRRNSAARVAETGSLRGRPSTHGLGQSRRESVERGARVAETGSLVPRQPREREARSGGGEGWSVGARGSMVNGH